MRKLLAALALAGVATTAAQAETTYNGGYLDFSLGGVFDDTGDVGVGVLDVTGTVDFTIDEYGLQFGATTTSYISGGVSVFTLATSDIHTYYNLGQDARVGIYYNSGVFLSGAEAGVEAMFPLGEAVVELSYGVFTDSTDVKTYGLGVFLPLSDRLDFFIDVNGYSSGSADMAMIETGAIFDLNAQGWALHGSVLKWYDFASGFEPDSFVQIGVRKELGGKGKRLFSSQPFLLLVP